MNYDQTCIFMRTMGQCSSNIRRLAGKIWEECALLSMYDLILLYNFKPVEYSFAMKHNWEVCVWDPTTNPSFLFFQQILVEHPQVWGSRAAFVAVGSVYFLRPYM